MGTSVPLLSGLAGGQLLGGFTGAGLGLQQGQGMYNGQLGQPGAYPTLPGQMAYQVCTSSSAVLLVTHQKCVCGRQTWAIVDELELCYYICKMLWAQ